MVNSEPSGSLPGGPAVGEPRWLGHGGMVWLVLLLLVGMGRIVATYPEFTQTIDETEHIAAGMEWLDRGTFVRGPEHPPLSRIAVAVGPYLDGLRAQERQDFWEEGNAILHANDRYFRTLSLARAGILPFFVLATLVLWHWTRTLYGTPAALVAALLFTSLPPVLAHAGFATTDLPLAATLLAALYAFDRWLLAPTLGRTLWLGLWGGLAVATKFSALLFLPVGGAALLLLRALARRGEVAPSPVRLPRALGLFGLSLVVGVLVLWSFYRFSMSPNGLPAPELWEGIDFVARHNRIGHLAYLLGDVSMHGWWYFFPVALAVKTPLPFLLLALLGAGVTIGLVREGKTALLLAPGLLPLALLVSVLPAQINIGLRHVLPLYPFLAMLGGLAVVTLWAAVRQRLAKRLLVVGLVGGQLYSGMAIHPDYLAYFNPLAGDRPEEVLVDSDLDWGQDLDRLAGVLQALRVPEVSICYFGSADLSRHGLPPWRRLPPFQPTTGWVATSTFCHRLGNYVAPYTGYQWLDAYQPLRQIGHSIRLYYIPAAGASAQKGPLP